MSFTKMTTRLSVAALMAGGMAFAAQAEKDN